VGGHDAQVRLIAVRICVVTQEYPPVTDYHGGIGSQYGRQLPELARLGHDVHVITLMPQSGEVESPCDGVHVHAIKRGRAWPWLAIDWARRVDTELRRLGPFDVILSPEFRGEVWRYSKDQSSGPLITHLLTSSAQLLSVRPGLTWLERNGPRTKLTLRMEREQAERSTALMAPGSAVLDWARELWPGIADVPTQIVPLSIDYDAVREAAQGQLPDSFPQYDDGPIVALASRLDGHKGAQHLVAAMDTVWRTHPDARLVFIGRDAPWKRGMMSDHLREVAGPRADRLHVLGYQPAEQYFASVKAADVIAIPSLWESFCLAALEAMALGRPVIGTRDNGFSEFIRDGENGFLVGRGEVDELAVAIDRLLGDDDLRARISRAAEATAARHDEAPVAPLYVDAFQRVIDGPRAK
jgi:glycosyltransferase involved in cell wall biosynthesis